MFNVAQFTIAKTWKQPKCPLTNDWIREMELETLILSEASQKEKDKYHMISHIQNLIYGTNEPFHRKENNGLGEKTCDCPGGRGKEWEGSGAWAYQTQLRIDLQ